MTTKPSPPREDMVECPHCGALNDKARASTRCRNCNLPLTPPEKSTIDPPRCTYAECVAAAAQILANACAHQATLTAEQAAAEAYRPGGPTIAQLTDRIRRLRAEAVARCAA